MLWRIMKHSGKHHHSNRVKITRTSLNVIKKNVVLKPQTYMFYSAYSGGVTINAKTDNNLVYLETADIKNISPLFFFNFVVIIV